MNMTPVESTTIRAVGYSPLAKVLRVAFHSGGTYDYADVPIDVHAELMLAKSAGSHFHAHVRHLYRGVKIEEKAAA